MSIGRFSHLVVQFRSDPRFRWQMLVLACMYLGYAALYMCRATVVISGPAMLDDPGLGLNKTAWGAIIGWGTAGTLIGKLANGILADRLGGRRVFMLALAFCMLATGLFSSMPGLLYFSLAYFLALFAKSAGWPSMANLIRVWYPQHWRGRIWGILSSSSRFSSLVTTLVLGSLLLAVSWRWVITTSAVITCGVLLLLFLVLKQSPADVGLETVASSDGDNQKRPHPLDDATLAEALRRFVRSPRVWLICMSIMSLAILMEFQSFIPIYLKETFGLTAGIAAITSSAFPIGCLVSVLAGGFIFDRLSKKKRIFLLGGMMVCAVLCVGVLLALPQWGLTGDFGLWTALFAIMIYGLAIAPCYYIPMSVFSVDFGGAHCGVLVGIIDAVGYLAAMSFDFLGGSVADQVDGWHQFLNILLGVSLCGSVTLPLFLLLDYRSARVVPSS